VQAGDNYVFSSSDYFRDEKGTLGARAWLALIIPYFFIYYIIYYGKQIKKLYPQSKDFTSLYYILSLGVTLLSLAAGVFFQVYSRCASVLFESGAVVANANKYWMYPAIAVCAGAMICYILQLVTVKKYFTAPAKKISSDY